MTNEEARTVLGLGPEPAGPEAVRAAYLARMASVDLDRAPGDFVRLRPAYELARSNDAGPADGGGGTVSPGEVVTAARAALAANPDSIEARRTLLSYLRYTDGPEAAAVLREGAQRHPDEFLDELMLHFAGDVPANLLARARDGAARRLLVADVQTNLAEAAVALETMRAALASAEAPSGLSVLRIALRPVFSLHARNHLDTAAEALTLVKEWSARATPASGKGDAEVATMLALAEDLARVDRTFPLDLRQVAARAGRLGEFGNAAYEARFAAGRLEPREVRRWRKRLPGPTPTLAKILGLDLTEDQLRPSGTPSLRKAVGWPALIVASVLFLAWRIHLVEQNSLPVFDPSLDPSPSPSQSLKHRRDLVPRLQPFREKTELEACAEPSSETCRRWRRDLPIDLLDGLVRPEDISPEGDRGIEIDDLGVVGEPQTSVKRPRTRTKTVHQKPLTP